MPVVNRGPNWVPTETDDVTPVQFLTDAEIAAGNYRLLEREPWYLRAAGAIPGIDIGNLGAAGYGAGQSPRWNGTAFAPADYYTEAEVNGLLNAFATIVDLAAHTNNTSNPHSVTAAQVGAYTTGESDVINLNGGTAYYVDATGGSNSNAGTSSATAWQTVAKVNSALSAGTIKSGDGVYFKRGETWTGTRLSITRSGVSGYPITFGAYGSGARPVIDGNDTDNCVYAIRQSWIVLENLRLTQGLDHGAKFDECTDIVVRHCEMDNAGNDNLLFINECDRCTVIGGSYHDAYNRTGTYIATGIEIADGGDTFLIDGASCYSNANMGISVHNHGAGDPQGLTDVPTNVVIRNVTSYSNTEHGLNIMSQGGAAVMGGITVEDSTFHSNTLEGIRIHRAGAATSDQVISGVGLTRITLYGNLRYAAYINGDNIDVVRPLVRIPAGGRNFNLINCKTVTVYHPTLYRPDFSTYAPLYIDGTRTDGITVRNGILMSGSTTNGTNLLVTTTGATTNVTINYMLYWIPTISHGRWLWNGASKATFAAWKTDSGQDANSPNPANPLFTDVAGGDFTLQGGSPALDVAVALGAVNDIFTGSAADLGYREKEV